MIRSLIGVLLVTFLAKANGECIFSGAYSDAAKYSIKFSPAFPTCREFHLGSFDIMRTLSLIFSNNAIDCSKANIVVTNQFRQPIFDFCQSGYTGIRYNGLFLIVHLIVNAPYGSINTDISLSFDDSSASTQAPPSTTTIPISSTATNPPPSTTTIILSTSGSSSLKCGVPAIKPQDSEMRIVGGVEAIPNSWPWQAFLTDGSMLCGASLINDQWLITAAHCINGNPMTVYLGAHDLSELYPGTGYKVAQIYSHPDYNKDGSLKNDIALLKLEKPVTFSDTIQPVCLPDISVAQPGRVGMATGWGKTSDNSGSSNTLQQVAVPIRSNAECYFFRLDSTQFCAGNTDASNVKDSCQGDSGGPLVTKEGSSYVLAGIVSFGGPSCDGNGVYTNVYSFMDWIQKTISSN